MATRVLLLGGHGKVALHMTPLMLAKSWNVTSVIRDASQTDDIVKLGEGQKGKVNVLLSSLEDVKSDEAAKRVIDEVEPDYVVWSAGAGGKGGYQRTYAIDRDAAKHFIAAATSTPSVKKFLLVSYIGSRHNRAPWWTDDEWAASEKLNKEYFPHYFNAKVEADEYLTAMAKKRHDHGDPNFQSIVLRPGSLTQTGEIGKVSLGKTAARGKIPRIDVAAVAVELLSRPDSQGWYDLLEGDEEIASAVNRVNSQKIDSIEGEDLERIYAKAT